MGDSLQQAVGGLCLAVRRGDQSWLVVPEIAAPPALATDAENGAAWTYAPRGHAGSDRVRGRYYTLTDFAVELLGLLELVHAAHGRPVLVEGRGAGALVAALAALAAPERVRGLVLRADGRGWGGTPQRLVAPVSAVTPGWRDAVAAAEPSPAVGLDPVLAVGPPRSIAAEELRDALASLQVPWWSAGGTPADHLLPARLRTIQPPD